jgi:C2 domain
VSIRYSSLAILTASTVIEARDLPLVGRKQQPDALVKIIAGDVLCRTEIIKANAHPRWDATFVLCASPPLCLYPTHAT